MILVFLDLMLHVLDNFLLIDVLYDFVYNKE